MKRKKRQQSTDVEYQVNVRSFNAPFALDDFMPSLVMAEFNFIEREELKRLVQQICEMDTTADIKVVEHAGPGLSREVFKGDAADYLIELEFPGFSGDSFTAFCGRLRIAQD
jgi:hypothetical protein